MMDNLSETQKEQIYEYETGGQFLKRMANILMPFKLPTDYSKYPIWFLPLIWLLLSILTVTIEVYTSFDKTSIYIVFVILTGYLLISFEKVFTNHTRQKILSKYWVWLLPLVSILLAITHVFVDVYLGFELIFEIYVIITLFFVFFLLKAIIFRQFSRIIPLILAIYGYFLFKDEFLFPMLNRVWN